MYLHLGADCMVKNSEIVAIINLCHPQSEACHEYVEKYKDAYKLVDATEGGEASSLVLTEDTLYLSAISSLISLFLGVAYFFLISLLKFNFLTAWHPL